MEYRCAVGRFWMDFAKTSDVLYVVSPSSSVMLIACVVWTSFVSFREKVKWFDLKVINRDYDLSKESFRLKRKNVHLSGTLDSIGQASFPCLDFVEWYVTLKLHEDLWHCHCCFIRTSEYVTVPLLDDFWDYDITASSELLNMWRCNFIRTFEYVTLQLHQNFWICHIATSARLLNHAAI